MIEDIIEKLDVLCGIKKEVEKIDASVFILKKAIEIGKLLNQAKEELGDDFGRWLLENTNYSRALAWNMMTLADNETGVLKEATTLSAAIGMLEPPKPK